MYNNDDGAKFCMECGSKIEVKEEIVEAGPYCPKCGVQNDGGAAFCKECGNQLSGERRTEKKETGWEEDEGEDEWVEDEPAPKEKEKIEKEPKKIETKVDAKHKTILTVNMKYPKNDATRVAKKELKGGGGLFSKKIETIDDAVLRYLPLIQGSFDIKKKKLFGMGEEVTLPENIYFHGINGKMLQVSDKLEFRNITDAKPENIEDLDNVAEFKEIDISMVQKKPEKARIGKNYISRQLMEMFGVELKTIKIIYLPIWKFNIINKDTKRSRIIYIDSVFGIPMEKNPFK